MSRLEAIHGPSSHASISFASTRGSTGGFPIKPVEMTTASRPDQTFWPRTRRPRQAAMPRGRRELRSVSSVHFWLLAACRHHEMCQMKRT